MSRPASKEPKSRLNLDLPLRTRDRLERLLYVTEADSFTEVIRRALAMYEVIVTVLLEKGKVILYRVDGTTQQIIIW